MFLTTPAHEPQLISTINCYSNYEPSYAAARQWERGKF